jgi:hypothetical protein
MPEKWIDVELTEDEQVIGALVSNAAAFALVGGPPLMLTEAVENSNDAIEHARRELGMEEKGFICVEVDTWKKEIRIIDNGTGVLWPIHLLKKPFKSMRKNVDYTKGQFGRGLQGFRGFCEDLFYITRRKKCSAEEEEILDKGSFSGKTVKLHLPHNTPRGTIEVVDDAEFGDYTDFETGTIAIYQNWFPGEMERIDLERLQMRVEHHFGELIRKGNITIILRRDGKDIETYPRTFNPDHKIPIDNITVKTAGGNVLGELEFNLYFTSQAFLHPYKKPYLVVSDRPLGDSFISDFPEFQHQTVWSSRYITGFIRSDFVKPNDLRLALEPGIEKDCFARTLLDAALEIEQQVKDFQRKLFNLQLEEEMNDLAVEVQRFLKNERVFDFQPTETQGLLSETEIQGGLDTRERGEMVSVIDSSAETTEEVLAPSKHEGKKGNGRGETQEGDWQQVKVDPKLRGHTPRRRRRRRPSGFPLRFEANELSEDMSWFEETGRSVILNSAHARFRSLQDRSLDRGEHSAYYAKLRVYVIQRYLWEIVMFAGHRQNLGREVLENRFWDLNYKFFETRSF